MILVHYFPVKNWFRLEIENWGKIPQMGKMKMYGEKAENTKFVIGKLIYIKNLFSVEKKYMNKNFNLPSLAKS